MKNYRSKLSKLPLRKRILIFTEGKTERDYLRCFKSRLQAGIQIKMKYVSKSKLALVQKIIKFKEKESLLEEDSVWVVMDRDELVGDAKDRDLFTKACALAEKHNIEIAYSNDAFELWPLLHFQEVRNHMNRKMLLSTLEEHCDNKYKKKGLRIFEILQKKGNLSEARLRADRLLSMHKKEGRVPTNANPSTTLHRLIKILQTNRSEG